MKKVIRYDLIGSYKKEIKLHPQKQVESLGIEVHRYRGEPIGDCIFMLVSNLPLNLPEYIELSDYKF
ncbi:hypothetical protein QWY81_17795 [Polaribacter undariae]|uniref:Uncharacterized protein n=1 Tax=Polaribacter sejongensis TaxID=985043 RepID=A0AAJ1R089_9FLAO|nr:hypothetical protein [Polaribacter undariae]MDN3621325.1 hypothetical protein [Polaribacter undariae]UWD31867.1 hypothetical protein NQP51_17260 [Polaribacter undariae]